MKAADKSGQIPSKIIMYKMAFIVLNRNLIIKKIKSSDPVTQAK